MAKTQRNRTGLCQEYDLNELALRNRVIMAPMTRTRAQHDHAEGALQEEVAQ